MNMKRVNREPQKPGSQRGTPRRGASQVKTGSRLVDDQHKVNSWYFCRTLVSYKFPNGFFLLSCESFSCIL